MNNFLKRKKIACFFKMLGNRLICLLGGEACELTCLLGEHTLCINGNDNRDFGIIFANHEVLNTVTGRSVNTAGARFESYMIADDNK